jgi:hypothetical protein
MTTTFDRLTGTQMQWLIPREDDPPAEADATLIYVRPVDGVLRTLARFPNGTVIIIL